MTDTLFCLLNNIAYVANDIRTAIASATDTLFYLMRGVAHVTSNPIVILYILQAAIYAVAAFLSRRAGHRELSVCYAGSSFIHGLLGACHLSQLEWC